MTKTTDLKDEHRTLIESIDAALDQLQGAITGEREFRSRVQSAAPEFWETLPKLKFPIVLTSSKAKPFDLITSWRRWARGSGWLKGE